MKRQTPSWAATPGFLLVKCLVLAAADFVSVWLAFAAAPVLYPASLPWALLNLLIVLVITDTVVLLYPTVKKRHGGAYALRWALITGAYYLLNLLLTPLLYWRLSPPVFGGAAVGMLLLYVAAALGILVSRRMGALRASVNGAALTVRMLELGNRVHALRPMLETRQWEGLKKAYTALRTCWEFAAPFGRSRGPVTVQMEAEIARRVETACEESRLLAQSVSEEGLQKLAQELLEINELLKTREKQMLE